MSIGAKVLGREVHINIPIWTPSVPDGIADDNMISKFFAQNLFHVFVSIWYVSVLLLC